MPRCFSAAIVTAAFDSFAVSPATADYSRFSVISPLAEACCAISHAARFSPPPAAGHADYRQQIADIDTRLR